MTFFDKISKNFSKLNITQKISVIVLIICIPLILALSVKAVNKSVNAMASLNSQESIYSEETSSEAASSEEITVSSEEESSSEEVSSKEEEEKEAVEIFLKPSSVEEDLEVKIVDAEGNMVTGYPFLLTVVAKNGSYNKDWTVDDGFLRLTKISSGEYTVTIADAEGYVIKENTIECTVEKKVEYEKIDVSDKVVDESEIDVEEEDAALTKPTEEPAATPVIVSYEDRAAEKKVTPAVYKYSADLVEDPVFTEKNVGYLKGPDKKYVIKVDNDGYIVDFRLAPEEVSAQADITFAQTDAPALFNQTIGDSALINTPYINSYSIVPLTFTEYNIMLMENPETPPSDEPTAPPTEAPTAPPTEEPTAPPTEEPTAPPTEEPTAPPTEEPTAPPTEAPTAPPTEAPTAPPTEAPTAPPTQEPTAPPTQGPTAPPTEAPTATPSATPTAKPTVKPSATPTAKPTAKPSATPTAKPTAKPSPSATPSARPSASPTATPSPTPSPTPVVYKFKDLKRATDIYENGKDGKLKASFVSHYGIADESIPEKIAYFNGWNDISRKEYYYDVNGTPIKGQANIGGVTYTFDNNGRRVDATNIAKGIDVSKWQGNIDWGAVKASGVEYAIIRVGYRGYGSGALVEDPYFRQNIQGATNAGLKVGVYFFSQAITTAEAVEEASMAINAVKGYNLHYPIYFDTEAATTNSSGRADGLGSGQRTDIANAFCQTVRNSGYKAGIYASKSWFMYNLNYGALSHYDIWLAHYTSATDFAHRYDMWQYTGSGSCPGVSGGVDLNWAYKIY